MSHSLVGVLREMRPRRALFTTYTFNPAFFEAAVLPAAFRPDGCQIRVLVDGGPLAASTHGSFAQHIGSRYAVAPVRAPGGGIFHPKIALLDTDDRQVLCVGSSNLTASGLARQLECLDVTDLSAEPAVALQLKTFLQTLALRCRSTSPRAADMLASAASWVRDPGPPTSDPLPAATLIHTLERSADAQLEELLRREGRQAQTLTVLAPFHSRDGAAVRALRRSLGAGDLRIAHLGTVTSSPQAYEGAAYVAPTERQSGQVLHAKVFEIETDDGVLVVSGSVNATFQSLQSTKNVEVSLARWAPSSPFQWEPCQPENFVPQEQVFEPACAWSVEAVLIGSDRLEALVQGDGSGQAQVAWILSTASAEIARGTATLDARGLLILDLSAPIGSAHDALVLHVNGPSGTWARGWVNDQRALRAVRDGVRLNSRSSGNGETGSEYRFATDLILRALEGRAIHDQAPGSRGAPTMPAKENGEALDEAFNYEYWVRSGQLRRPPGSTLGRRTGAFLTRVLNLLFPEEDAQEEEEQIEPDPIALGEADPADEDGEQRTHRQRATRTPRAQAEREQLLKACQAVREAFEVGREGIASAELLVLAICALDTERAQAQFLARSASESRGIDAHRVLVLWLDCISRYSFDAELRDDLLPMACAIAAATAAVPPRVNPEERHLSHLRDAIRRLAGRPVADDEVLNLVARGMREEIMLRLHPRFREAAAARAAELAQAPTFDDLLLHAIRQPADPRTPASMTSISSALRRWPESSRGLALLTGTEVRLGGCPICYRHFSYGERRELTYQRWMLHGNGRPHVLAYPDDINRFR